MLRVLPIAGFAVASLLGLAGCAGTWDMLTSRKFRDAPWDTTKKMVRPEDPLVVLRADPPRDGNDRARAMHRLKEPLANKGTQEEQEFVMDLLGRAATSDPSPVLRLSAIAALGRFQDPRAPEYLVIAYRSAHGRPAGVAAPAPNPIQLASATSRPGARVQLTADIPFTGPTGFPPDTVAAIRCRAAESLGQTGTPDAARFLATVAGVTGPEPKPEGADDREVRMAAIRGLGHCRQPEAVVALAQVLGAEAGKRESDDVVRRTHEGLVRLTGKKLPPDPQQWEGVVQAGVVIAPPPTWVDTAVEQAVHWVRQQ